MTAVGSPVLTPCPDPRWRISQPAGARLQPPASELNVPGGRDIEPGDGWVLLYRDFGSPNRGTPLPVFVLYNRFRGVLRIFYFNTLISQSYSFATVKLSQPFASKAAALFTFDDPYPYIQSYDRARPLLCVGKLGYFQWSYADFVVVGYDSDLQPDATLRFEISGTQQSELTLTGGLTLSQVLETRHLGGGVDLVNSTRNGFTTGNSYYKAVGNARNDLKSMQEKNPNAWWSSTILSIINDPLISFLPKLAGVAGFVKGFIGHKESQVMPLNFSGEIQASGQLSTANFLYQIDLRVPGAPHSDPTDTALPLYDRPLGIFNVAAAPLLQQDSTPYCYEYAPYDYICYGTDYWLLNPLEVRVNSFPDATVTVEAGWDNSVMDMGTGYEPLANFNSSRDYLPYGSSGPGIALLVTIHPNLAPPDENIVIMKSYPRSSF